MTCVCAARVLCNGTSGTYGAAVTVAHISTFFNMKTSFERFKALKNFIKVVL